jgi:multidrug efflux pump subunit AcrA (membrane-fusion protein)
MIELVACVAHLAAAPPVVTVCRPIAWQTSDFDFAGRLDPARVSEVGAEVGGLVQKVPVAAGDEVRPGTCSSSSTPVP